MFDKARWLSHTPEKRSICSIHSPMSTLKLKHTPNLGEFANPLKKLKGSHREQDNPLEILGDASLFQQPSINKKKDNEIDLQKLLNTPKTFCNMVKFSRMFVSAAANKGPFSA
jgi:hypothetical protein